MAGSTNRVRTVSPAADSFDKRCDGQSLGPVGSTIVAETMLGMLAADPLAFSAPIPPGSLSFRCTPAASHGIGQWRTS
jgi:hypothetical protein